MGRAVGSTNGSTSVIVTGSPRTPLGGDRSVVVDVPARQGSLRLIRLAVADAAAALDMDESRIEGARIAVDELATILITSSEWSRLRVRCDSSGGRLRVEGIAAGALGHVGEVRMDRVVKELLGLSVETYGLSEGPGFWFTVDAPEPRRAR